MADSATSAFQQARMISSGDKPEVIAIKQRAATLENALLNNRNNRGTKQTVVDLHKLADDSIGLLPVSFAMRACAFAGWNSYYIADLESSLEKMIEFAHTEPTKENFEFCAKRTGNGTGSAKTGQLLTTIKKGKLSDLLIATDAPIDWKRDQVPTIFRHNEADQKELSQKLMGRGTAPSR